jgi:16S rRNA (adenine1518-N6/adenine1519-N6)-dimethyltransferase
MKFLRYQQHILASKQVLERICEYSKLNDKDAVLEVGCGTGNLTEFLLRNSRIVYGIEIDLRYIKALERRFANEIKDGRFVLIHGDALKTDFPHFTKFVSNIPYKISSPLTFKLLKHDFKLAVVMYQKEFAERLIAKQGSESYGRLSIIVKSYCKAEILEFVPKTAFKPIPKVDSAIVRFIPEPEITVHKREVFEDLVRFVFSRRRKMLGKSITEWCEMRGIQIQIPDVIKKKRPEELEPKFYAEIADSALT